ncbi:hypothetical protein BC834DRAFT_123666 [Gloeopeniophorella convolvens]|nr:hypothetical protein BC834DRAFT_123666 [Gloeopeniophorella convolvens]
MLDIFKEPLPAMPIRLTGISSLLSLIHICNMAFRGVELTMSGGNEEKGATEQDANPWTILVSLGTQATASDQSKHRKQRRTYPCHAEPCSRIPRSLAPWSASVYKISGPVKGASLNCQGPKTPRIKVSSAGPGGKAVGCSNWPTDTCAWALTGLQFWNNRSGGKVRQNGQRQIGDQESALVTWFRIIIAYGRHVRQHGAAR